MTHWTYALISTLVFMGALFLLFPGAYLLWKRIVITGLLTGTVGIIALLAFQVVADFATGFEVRGRGVVVALFYFFKFIGLCYAWALDEGVSFGQSLVGFTFGVGMCEEGCKAVPILIYYASQDRPTWRGASLIGLASGIGFGVSEGIHYSAHMYNGLAEMLIYIVRFTSCVALHAVWSGAAAIAIYHRQDDFFDSESLDKVKGFAMCFSGPILLHALYDTFLKYDNSMLAFLAATLSFAWCSYMFWGSHTYES